MNKSKLRIHSSHFVCGGQKYEMNNLKKLADIFFVKKNKGITMDITKFHSDIVDIEYNESIYLWIKVIENLHILQKNKTIKIDRNEFVILEINNLKNQRGELDLEKQKSQVSIFSDYLSSYLFNSRVKFYKKILFKNYEEVKNLFFDNNNPNFLNIVYMKNTAFFANEVFFHFYLLLI